MKIYQVEFKNKKWFGENNIEFTVKARSISEAEKVAIKLLKQNSGWSNWMTVKVKLIAEVENA